MKRFSTVLFSLGLATGLPVLAHAERDDTSTYRLSYSTSDLSSADRVAELHARIEKTAREHCPSYFTSRSISDTRNCVREVTGDLVKRINNPRLTAYAAGEKSVELADATTPHG